jgi:hypothetical protein
MSRPDTLRWATATCSTIIGFGALLAWAQDSPADRQSEPKVTRSPQIDNDSAAILVPAYLRPQATHRFSRRSVVHHYAYPYPDYYHGDETAGFRNPGGVGRHAEYYPPGDRFQIESDPTRVARFDSGGGPNRAEQLAAQRLGIARSNSLQYHIDRYAMPHYGYGFGVGFYGGFW